MQKIILGANASTVSKIRAYRVGIALQKLITNLSVDYIFQEGDPFQLLQEKKVNAIIQSWTRSDAHSDIKTNTISVLKREDQRDILLLKKTCFQDPPPVLGILNSSRLREFNLEESLPLLLPFRFHHSEIDFKPIKGELLSNLREFENSSAHGFIWAKSSLDNVLSASEIPFEPSKFENAIYTIRNILKECYWMVLPLSIHPNIPAQGTIVAEFLDNDRQLEELFSSISEVNTEECSLEERRIYQEFSKDSTPKLGVSCINRRYGDILFLKGQRNVGEKLSIARIQTNPKFQFQRDEVWPIGARKVIRKRTRIAIDIPMNADLYISRVFAVPDDLKFTPEDGLIWSSSVSTWRDLAIRDYWVWGSSDGLGEIEPMNIDILLNRPKRFIKLTHTYSDLIFRKGSVKKNTLSEEDLKQLENTPVLDTHHYDLISRIPPLASYHVVPPELPKDIDPNAIKAAFWRSSQEYSILTEHYPFLKNVTHFCNPDATLHTILSDLGDSALNKQVFVYLSFEDWVHECIVDTERRNKVVIEWFET